MKQTVLAAMLIGLIACGQASAGITDVYMSYSDFGDGNAIDNTANSSLSINDTGSLFIWVDENFSIDTGAFLDVTNDNTSVAEFTNATVFQYDITVGGTTVNTRWQNSAIDSGDLTAGFIDEMRGFRVNEGTGILPSQATGNSAFLDEGHDPSSNGFLFAQIDFVVVGEGTANFSLAVGDGLIVDNGVELTPDFAGASLTVAGTAIPEPTTAGLLALGVCGIVARRRR